MIQAGGRRSLFPSDPLIKRTPKTGQAKIQWGACQRAFKCFLKEVDRIFE